MSILLLVHCIYPAFVSLQVYLLAQCLFNWIKVVTPEDKARFAAESRYLGTRIENDRLGGEVEGDERSHIVAERARECEQLQVVREKQCKVAVNL